jgi:iron complex transport system substrate-binding protein
VIAPNNIIGSRFEDRKALLKLYAQALGPEEEKVAQDYCAYFDAKLQTITSITSRIPISEKPTVYFAIRKPLMTGGKTSILPRIVDAAGGECVTKDLNMNFGQVVSMEQLLAWNPDVIVMDHCSISSLSSGPAEENIAAMLEDERFSHIEAVKQQRMYISPTGVFFWDSGQQVILQVMWLAKILHPERFRHINMVKELKYFYTTFFRYDLTDEEATQILQHLPPFY